jgi:hypothetical protein
MSCTCNRARLGYSQGSVDALRTAPEPADLYILGRFPERSEPRCRTPRRGHILLDPTVAPSLKLAADDRNVRRWEKAAITPRPGCEGGRARCSSATVGALDLSIARPHPGDVGSAHLLNPTERRRKPLRPGGAARRFCLSRTIGTESRPTISTRFSIISSTEAPDRTCSLPFGALRAQNCPKRARLS